MKTIKNKIELEEEFKKNEKCVVKIGTETCGPCKVVMSTLSVMESKYLDIAFLNVDADESEDICDFFNIRNIPTLIYVKNGNVIERTTGLRTSEQISETIEKNLTMY